MLLRLPPPKKGPQTILKTIMRSTLSEAEDHSLRSTPRIIRSQGSLLSVPTIRRLTERARERGPGNEVVTNLYEHKKIPGNNHLHVNGSHLASL